MEISRTIKDFGFTLYFNFFLFARSIWIPILLDFWFVSSSPNHECKIFESLFFLLFNKIDDIKTLTMNACCYKPSTLSFSQISHPPMQPSFSTLPCTPINSRFAMNNKPIIHSLKNPDATMIQCIPLKILFMLKVMAGIR